MTDSFLTIAENAEGIYKDRGSKFLAYAFPVETEEEIKNHIQALKKTHYSARHHCYAWRLGADKKRYRANDDGEPSSTAGKPILGQIRRLGLSNILIVVVRYFGGTLLGVSGLINAYKQAAADVLSHTKTIEKLVEVTFKIEFAYENMNQVMRIFKDENLQQKDNQFELNCIITSSIRKNEAERVLGQLRNIEGIKIAILE